MKKSELLALLKQDIKDAAGDLDLQAEMVLARCLSVGMFPPEAADFNIGNNWEPEEIVVICSEPNDDNRYNTYSIDNTDYGKDISNKINEELLKMRDDTVSEIYDILKVYKESDGTLTYEKILTVKDKFDNM